jgi:eukaryotic-like serine/threonine-protein kinase
VLGRYRLVEAIGSGGHGTVWIAEDQELRRRVAVKRIPRSRDGDGRERMRVDREARAAARLAHPAIVALLDSGEDDGAHYLVSELVDGNSLAALYRDGGLQDRSLLAIGDALADALEHAHERGVVHRDVKPHNVIVPSRRAAGDAPAKLTDFGIARLADEHPLTSTGDIVGTFEYMAPEQAEGRPAGPHADLYSLALTLYEGLAGANPLRGRTVAATAKRVGEVVPPLAGVRPDLPPALCAAIDRALTPAVGARGTVAQLRVAVRAALAPPAGRPRRRWADPRSQAPRIAITPRARSLLGACGAGALAGTGMTTVIASHTVALGVLAGTVAAATVVIAGSAGWLSLALAAVAALGASGRPGSAMLLAAVLLPGAVLLVGRPWLWSAPALGPLLGLAGLAGFAPLLAGRIGGPAPARAALAALAYWWLAIVEVLSGRRLLYGAPTAVGPRASWQGSLSGAYNHALAPLWSDGRLVTAALWALAAVVLPWIVRGASLESRALGAIAWTVALLLAAALLAARVGVVHPPSPLLPGVLLACAALASALPRGSHHTSIVA